MKDTLDANSVDRFDGPLRSQRFGSQSDCSGTALNRCFCQLSVKESGSVTGHLAFRLATWPVGSDAGNSGWYITADCPDGLLQTAPTLPPMEFYLPDVPVGVSLRGNVVEPRVGFVEAIDSLALGGVISPLADEH